jgi:hypothetical protein
MFEEMATTALGFLILTGIVMTIMHFFSGNIQD